VIIMAQLDTNQDSANSARMPQNFAAGGGDGLSTRGEAPSTPVRAPAQRAPSTPDQPAAPAKTDSAPQMPSGDSPAKPKSNGLRRVILALMLAGVIGAGAYYSHHWWTVGRFLVSTDDAYVKADMSVISSREAGYVTDVPVIDNQQVKAGQLLARIDARDYRIAVDAAKARIATQDATIARLKEQAKAQGALIDQAKAQIASAEAGLTRAAADFSRAQDLAAREFGSRQTLDQARAERDQAQAAVASAKAALVSAEANLGVINAQVEEAVRGRAELESNLDQANLNLSYTEVRAPFDGVVGNKAVQPGQYVTAGTRLLALVPLNTVYVEANYKETQLAGIHPGQTVDVEVDAADGRQFEGTVESIAPASGSQFSLLPPENATGNFTKIVQRVPVRIRVSGDAVSAGVLRPGLSVVTAVHTKADEPATAAEDRVATTTATAQAAPAR
jgi:membrane fusion protein (multidrug efflux system)